MARIADDPTTWTDEERRGWDQRYGTNLSGTNQTQATGATTPSPGEGWVLVNGGWLPPGHPGIPSGQQPAAAAPTQTEQPAQSSTPSAGWSSSATTASTTPVWQPPPGAGDALWNQLMERATQGLNVTGNEPHIRQQVDAFSAAQDRAARNMISDLAEAGSPYNTGAQLGQRRMAAETAGRNTAQMQAELMGREVQAKRDEIAAALAEQGELLSESQRNSLTLQLAELDNALDRMRIENQDKQFWAGLSQNDRQFLQRLAQEGRFQEMDDAFRRLQLSENMGLGWANLRQEGDQFLDRLGFDIEQADNYWDWRQRGND